jgi:PAS domain-containing protein
VELNPASNRHTGVLNARRNSAPVRGLGIAVAIVAVQLMAIYGRWPVHRHQILLNNLCQLGGPAALALWYAFELWRQFHGTDHAAAPSTRTFRVSLLIAFGSLAYALGQTIWTYEEWHGLQPFPSAADAFFIASPLLLLSGILLIPRPVVSQSTRIRIFLDGLMIVMAAITFSWYFILGPTILQSRASTLTTAIATFYPTADILLLTCLIMVAGQARYLISVDAVWAIGAGLVCVVISDSVFGYQSVHNLYKTGSLIDIGWTLGYALFAIGARLMCLPSKATVEEDRRMEEDILNRSGSIGLAALPYLLLPAVVTLAVKVMLDSNEQQYVSGVLTAGGALILLLILRQLTTLAENRQLAIDLCGLNAGLEQEIARRTEEIVAKENERRVVETALTEREQQIQAIVKHLPVAIFSFDRNGTVSLLDAPAPVLAGDAVGIEWGRILGFLGRSPETEIALQTAFAGTPVSQTISFDGTTIQLYLVPRVDERLGGVECVQALAIDATDRAAISPSHFPKRAAA